MRFHCNIIMQILTVTVMKYQVSVDCQESYIFPRGYNHEGKYYYLGNHRRHDISSVPVNIWYIRWSKWMISSKFDSVLSQTITKLRTRLGLSAYTTIWMQTWQLEARFLLWRSIVNCCVLDYAGHFFLGQFPNMETVIVVALFLIEFVIFSRLVKYNSVFPKSMRRLTTWASQTTNISSCS